MAEQRWAVVWFDTLGIHDVAIVEAETEEEAAEDGMAQLQNEESDETVDNVYVLPWNDRVAYSRRIAVERSQFQCCGGGDEHRWIGHDGHFATCRTLRKDEDEQAA